MLILVSYPWPCDQPNLVPLSADVHIVESLHLKLVIILGTKNEPRAAFPRTLGSDSGCFILRKGKVPPSGKTILHFLKLYRTTEDHPNLENRNI